MILHRHRCLLRAALLAVVPLALGSSTAPAGGFEADHGISGAWNLEGRVGDTLFIDGEVTRTFVDGDRHCVEIRQEARNQDGELSVRGSGVVRLPGA